MSGVEKLQERIIEDAGKQAKKNIENASSEASGIINRAEAEAGQKKKDVLERAEKRAGNLKDRLLAIAQLEARKKKLQARQDVINEAFCKALEKMENLPPGEYRRILADMIVYSVKDGDEEVVLSAKDRERLGLSFIDGLNSILGTKGIKGNVKLSSREGDFKGGFILKKGKTELNNTFKTVVNVMRNSLEEETVNILFNSKTNEA